MDQTMEKRLLAAADAPDAEARVAIDDATTECFKAIRRALIESMQRATNQPMDTIISWPQIDLVLYDDRIIKTIKTARRKK